MKFKAIYLVVTMFVFLVGVFLDQNRNPVPIKIIFGTPFQIELTLIIIMSMIVGALIAIAAVYLMKKKKDSAGGD